MNVTEFVESIYLGDRACKKLVISSWVGEVLIEVDVISRIRSPDGDWNFYSDEDIENGLLVFKEVKRLQFKGADGLPNDAINYLKVDERSDEDYEFSISIDSVSDDGGNTEVVLILIASAICLRDPEKPDVDIVD